jgi:hypothetical protein
MSAPAYYNGMGRQAPFKVNYDTDSNGNPRNGILTNVSAAQAVYTVNNPSPANWDSHFQAAFVASLGAFLIPALSLHLPLMNAMIGSAERAIAAARTSDGNEGETTQDHLPDWIRARGTSHNAGYNNCWDGNGYDNMAWPGVI